AGRRRASASSSGATPSTCTASPRAACRSREPMSEGIRRVFEAVDYDELVREFPPPPEYFETAWRASPEAIERVQLRRLRERARAATHVPFFAKRWEAAGFDADSIAKLDDLWRAPAAHAGVIPPRGPAHAPRGGQPA